MQLSRRELLLHLARGAAGAGAAGLFSDYHDLGLARVPQRARVTRGNSTASLPKLAAVATTSSHNGAQVFRSRPDLHPPVITVNTLSKAIAPGLILTDAHAGPSDQGPMILDGNGDLVWFLDLSPGSSTALRAFNFQVQTLAGKPVLTWFQGAVVNGHGQGHYELWDTTYTKVAEVDGKDGYLADLHEFVLTPTGTALFTCYGEEPADLTKYGGKKGDNYFYGVVQEVDVSTGALLFQWRSDDYVTLAESYEPITSNTVPWDYFHVNSIQIDPTDGNLLISGRNTWTIYKVHRTSGKVLWRLGGKQSDFKVAPSAHYAFQHDPRRYPDGSMTMFDNEGGPPKEASQSRGLLISVNEKSRTAGLLRAIYHTPPVLSEALGSVQELSDGHMFMSWGESSYISEYDSTGKVLFDAQMPKLTESYRAFKQAWAGQPTAETPALAVAAGSSTATLYASYNGCTDVAGWVVLGGATSKGLAALGYAESLGFETAITVHSPPAYVAVQAVASAGQVLASSAAQHGR